MNVFQSDYRLFVNVETHANYVKSVSSNNRITACAARTCWVEVVEEIS